MISSTASKFPFLAPSVTVPSRPLILPVSTLLPLGLAVIVTWAWWTLPPDLAADARLALIVTSVSLIGWVGTRIQESLVALAAAVMLVVTGAMPEERLYAALGSDLTWLLLAAFIIAAVVKEAGLAERLVAPLTASQPRFARFAFALAIAVAFTALVMPSTSGRAALLLPVFLALLPLLPDARLAKALSLLFPTVILLSAGGSLIGAGAHLIAVEAIAATGGPRLGYLDWLMLGAPLAALASAAGVGLILLVFVPRDLWSARMAAAPKAGPLTLRQARILGVVIVLVALWLTEALHGLGMALVAVLGALTLLTKPFSNRKTKEVFRAVDMELIVYMAATMLMAQAMTQTGADRWLAAQAMALLPETALSNGPAMVVAMSIIAVVAHLAIASRSARAAILIPAVALPIAGMGHDATLMILIAVMGTGFCQSLMASAKPVAIYGTREEAGFSQADLLRLAFPLGAVKIALLVVFALFVWPSQTTAHFPPMAPSYPTSDIRKALAADLVLQTIEPAIVVIASIRPMARPADLLDEQVANPPTRSSEKRRTKRSAKSQFELDLQAAGRQIRRDLRGLFR